jgi:hypothetical protein
MRQATEDVLQTDDQRCPWDKHLTPWMSFSRWPDEIAMIETNAQKYPWDSERCPLQWTDEQNYS